MKTPSKKTHKIDLLRAQKEEIRVRMESAARQSASAFKKVADEFATAEKEIARIESEEDDLYTCFLCDQDFPPGGHIDILAVAVNIHNEPGDVERHDFGVIDARRLMICPTCDAGKRASLRDYLYTR